MFEFGEGEKAAVTFYAPRPDGDDWRCDYRIEWPGRIRSSYAFGVDSVQALLLAMQMARADLTNAEEVKGRRLTWLGQSDLGLPKASNS